jgi:hypothetical protein
MQPTGEDLSRLLWIIEVPMPESLIAYFMQNRTITIYPLTIKPESLIEAKGIYNFWKNSLKILHKTNSLL